MPRPKTKSKLLPDSVALGYAIKAALHDRHLEDQGAKIIYFFDTDVICSSIFSRDEMGDGEIESRFASRRIVSSLWLQGQMPLVRLTLPHLDELERVLYAIERRGGIEKKLEQRSEAITTLFGLGSSEGQRLKVLLDDLANERIERDDTIARIVDSLGMQEFGVIEALLAAQSIYRHGALREQLELKADLGEDLTQIEAEDDWFLPITQELQKHRKGKAEVNRNDAASLLAITHLWNRDASNNIEYRFYTHTEVLRRTCANNALARLAVTKPGCELLDGENPIDSPRAFLRSSRYFMARVAFASLSFSGGNTETRSQSEWEFLEDSADSLVVAWNNEKTPTKWRKLARRAPDESLTKTLEVMRDLSFSNRLLKKRREVVLNSLRRLRELPGVRQLEGVLNESREEVFAQFGKELSRTRRQLRDVLAISHVRKYLRVVNVLSPYECEESLSRWKALFDEDAAFDAAVAGLKTICGPGGPEFEKWFSDAVGTLADDTSIYTQRSVIVPFLCIGESKIPREILDERLMSHDSEARLAEYVLLIWSLTLPSLREGDRKRFLDICAGFHRCHTDVELYIHDEKPKTRNLMLAWIAVYASIALQEFTDKDSVSELLRMVDTGSAWAETCMDGDSSAHSTRMAWSARLYLGAIQVLRLDGQVDALRHLYEAFCAKYFFEQSTYLENASNLAISTIRKKGGHPLGRLQRTWKAPVFEPFQIVCRDLAELQ